MSENDDDLAALRMLIDQRRAGPFITLEEGRRQVEARWAARKTCGELCQTGPTDERECESSGDPDQSARHEARAGEHRAEIAEALSALKEACARQPRRYVEPIDVDKVVITSVNVPFPTQITPEALSDSIARNVVPDEFADHLARFLAELSPTDILRFCDRHHIGPDTLARFVRGQRARLALHRPELDEHLDLLVPVQGRSGEGAS